MDNERIKLLAEVLGMEPTRLATALQLVEGVEEEEEAKGPGNFYFNPNVFMKLHSIDCAGLRKLVMPNLGRLRR